MFCVFVGFSDILNFLECLSEGVPHEVFGP